MQRTVERFSTLFGSNCHHGASEKVHRNFGPVDIRRTALEELEFTVDKLLDPTLYFSDWPDLCRSLEGLVSEPHTRRQEGLGSTLPRAFDP